MGMITPPPIVRWQKWALQRTAYVRVFYLEDVLAVFAETHPHAVKALEELSLAPGRAVSMLYNADDDSPMRLYGILDDALADAEKNGFVVVSIDWAG
jgi:hypothetical protein